MQAALVAAVRRRSSAATARQASKLSARSRAAAYATTSSTLSSTPRPHSGRPGGLGSPRSPSRTASAAWPEERAVSLTLSRGDDELPTARGCLAGSEARHRSGRRSEGGGRQSAIRSRISRKRNLADIKKKSRCADEHWGNRLWTSSGLSRASAEPFSCRRAAGESPCSLGESRRGEPAAPPSRKPGPVHITGRRHVHPCCICRSLCRLQPHRPSQPAVVAHPPPEPSAPPAPRIRA